MNHRLICKFATAFIIASPLGLMGCQAKQSSGEVFYQKLSQTYVGKSENARTGTISSMLSAMKEDPEKATEYYQETCGLYQKYQGDMDVYKQTYLSTVLTDLLKGQNQLPPESIEQLKQEFEAIAESDISDLWSAAQRAGCKLT